MAADNADKNVSIQLDKYTKPEQTKQNLDQLNIESKKNMAPRWSRPASLLVIAIHADFIWNPAPRYHPPPPVIIDHITTTTPVDPSLPILGYLPVKNGSQAQYVRFTDDFNCDNFGFNEFVECYMQHFGFNHMGGFNYRPPELQSDRWMIGLQIVFNFIKYHTDCDLAAKMLDPEAKACPERTQKYSSGSIISSQSKGNLTVTETDDSLEIYLEFPDQYSWIYKKSNSLKVTKDQDQVYRIEINANAGYRRLVMSQRPNHRRWLRIHCYYCGAWIDILEDCHQRTVHFSDSSSSSFTFKSHETSDTSKALPQSSIVQAQIRDIISNNDPNTATNFIVPFAKNCHLEEKEVKVETFRRQGFEPTTESPTTTRRRPHKSRQRGREERTFSCRKGKASIFLTLIHAQPDRSHNWISAPEHHSSEYDVIATTPVDLSAPILGYLPVQLPEGSPAQYVRFTDDFNCDNFGFNEFVECYMEHFGFNHMGGFNFRPEELQLDRWVIGLQVVFAFIKHHTGCDLAAKMVNPDVNACPLRVESSETTTTTEAPAWWSSHHKETRNLSIAETDDSLDIHLSLPDDDSWRSNKHNNILKVTKDKDQVYRFEINANSGNRRLLMSQRPNHRRWLRIRCYYCGAWIDIVEDCDQRNVHFSRSRNHYFYSRYGLGAMSNETDTSDALPVDSGSDENEIKDADVSSNGAPSNSDPNTARNFIVPFASNCREEVKAVVIEDYKRQGLEPPTEAPPTTEKPKKLRRGDILIPRGHRGKYNRKIWFAHSDSDSSQE
ncbi:hypothetical protein Ddc_15493 [Ditylenchus destructor]|nr:hypothetical protein Ddc_15493 [Ditylenchus destructor]